MNELTVNPNACLPLALGFDPAHAFVTAGVVRAKQGVETVLRSRSRAKVVPLVVLLVPVTVIDRGMKLPGHVVNDQALYGVGASIHAQLKVALRARPACHGPCLYAKLAIGSVEEEPCVRRVEKQFEEAFVRNERFVALAVSHGVVSVTVCLPWSGRRGATPLSLPRLPMA